MGGAVSTLLRWSLATASARERAEQIDWPRVSSLALACGQATIAIVCTLATVMVSWARSGGSKLKWVGAIGWSRVSSAGTGFGEAGVTIAYAFAARAARWSRATEAALAEAVEAGWTCASSGAVMLGRAAAATGDSVVTTVRCWTHATQTALQRAWAATRDRASSAAVTVHQAIVCVADRSAAALIRYAQAARAELHELAEVAWACVSLPPIVVGRATVAAAQMVTATAVRCRQAAEIALERAADIGRAVVSAPASALEAFRADSSCALARLSAILIFAMGTANIFFLRWENFGYYWYRPFLNTYSIAVAGFILSRFVAALFYRPPAGRGLEPTVSIVVTAFNEEDAILRTIECCRDVDYPSPKLEVVVVDDGSTDGTSRELERARKLWPDLAIVRFEQNRGKREAMAAGARIARGDVLVYVDSDSFLRRDAVRQIVQGFADPSVAAVAGHTDVANRGRNALTRMQDVRYYVAFRVLKAAESVFGAVTCCPGCFSAYRRDRVLPILDRWLEQRFLGVRATFGDDRSLTNFLLRYYKVIYSSTAIATTIVPDQHGKFLRQQLRWKKSWLRECLIAATFMWKKHPVAAVGFYAQLVFPILAPILLLRAFVWMPLVAGDPFSIVIYAYGVTLIGLIFSSYYLFWKVDGSWLYGVYFTVYYMFVLIWQMPYAIATSRDNRWGTR
ncbi:MAG TPA: glycosyltransferase [Candidatus Binatia bacterium]|nr:glycosyltransferase [Candidatus Binatia bacterium]